MVQAREASVRVDGAFVQPLADLSRSLDREISDLMVQALFQRMRYALLSGQSLEAPRLGELIVHRKRPYALVNPVSGRAETLGGERTILFRPDRQLLRDLNGLREEDHVG